MAISKGTTVETAKGIGQVVGIVENNQRTIYNVRLDNGCLDAFTAQQVTPTVAAASRLTGKANCEAHLDSGHRCKNRASFVPGFGYVCGIHRKGL